VGVLTPSGSGESFTNGDRGTARSEAQPASTAANTPARAQDRRCRAMLTTLKCDASSVRELGSLVILPSSGHLAPPKPVFALTPEQVCRAYCECFELWLADEHGPADIAPLGELLSGVLRRHAGHGRVTPYHERKRLRESAFVIGTDGSVGGANELLDLKHAYGNLFEEDLSQLLASEGHQRSVIRAEAAIQRACVECPFFANACSGAPIAESEKDFRTFGSTPRARCPVTHPVLAYMARRLRVSRHRDHRFRRIVITCFAAS
jgi:radical SAM protein with 4Fe4S-binding SPASM domain